MFFDMRFPHAKNIFCDLSGAKIILLGHESQNISEILCDARLLLAWLERIYGINARPIFEQAPNARQQAAGAHEKYKATAYSFLLTGPKLRLSKIFNKFSHYFASKTVSVK